MALAAAGGMANISKSMAHERVFHFKDTEAEIAYFEKYGRGGLLENVVFGLELSAQRVGLMRRLGPNAKANLEGVADEIGYKLRTGSDPKAHKRFQERKADIFKRHFACQGVFLECRIVKGFLNGIHQYLYAIGRCSGWCSTSR